MADMKNIKIMKSYHGPHGPIGFASGRGFYLRLEPLESLSKFEALSFSIHEGIPGHFFYYNIRWMLVSFK